MFQNDYIENLDLDNFIVKKVNLMKVSIKPNASVIIVTYNNSDLLLSNLDNLNKQTVSDFEIIIIDNNEKIDIFPLIKKYPINYIKLKKNYGLSFARNIGIKLARGEIVIFLDDDAIPANDFIEEHIRAYKENDILGLRGKSLPRTPTIYNYFASHYDYGDKTIPCFINLEGNSSFKRDVLIEIGGFNPKLQGAGGYEGLELTYRIVSKYKDKSKLIYYPNAVIYHDYSHNFVKYLRKALRHAKYKDIIEGQFKDIFKLFREYKLSSENSKKDVPSLSLRVKIIMIRKITLFTLRVKKILNILYCRGKK